MGKTLSWVDGVMLFAIVIVIVGLFLWPEIKREIEVSRRARRIAEFRKKNKEGIAES